jgi:hypothetical protein
MDGDDRVLRAGPTLASKLGNLVTADAKGA